MLNICRYNLCSVYLLGITFFSATFPITNAWLLTQLNLNESYRIRHLSTHYSRVFLSISSESRIFPTLIEAPWPQTYMPDQPQIYPSVEMHANGNHSDCDLIQQAVWTQVDSLSRLWVMDVGWQGEMEEDSCPPKLLVFDLVKNDVEVLRIDCGDYLPTDVAESFVIKLAPRLHANQNEKFIYFILIGQPILLAYDTLEQKWHRRKLMSAKYKNVTETFPIQAVDLVFGKDNELLISDTDGLLYRTKKSFHLLTNKVKRKTAKWCDDDDMDLMETIELEPLGTLLGRSKGMMIDGNGALFYAVPKFGAVVRAEYKEDLTAEDNEIIYITLKTIQQIFFGAENSIWLLTDRLLSPENSDFLGLQ